MGEPNIHLSIGGQSYGPVDEETVRAWAAQGAVTGCDYFWDSVASEWRLLSEASFFVAPSAVGESQIPAELIEKEKTTGTLEGWFGLAREWRRLGDGDGVRRCLGGASRTAKSLDDFLAAARTWKEMLGDETGGRAAMVDAEASCRSSADWLKCAAIWKEVFKDPEDTAHCEDEARRASGLAPAAGFAVGAHGAPEVDTSGKGGCLKAFAALVIILGFVSGGWAFASYHFGSHRPFVLVNGLDMAYEVTVDGEAPILLQAFQRHETELAEGDHVFRFSIAGQPPEEHSMRYAVSFWARPFFHPKHVVNLDRCAALLWEEMTYEVDAPESTEEQIPIKIHVGQPHYAFDDVDLWWEDDFPENVSVSEGTKETKRTRISTDLVNLRVDERLALILEKAPENACEFASRWSLYHPESDTFLLLAVNCLGSERATAFLSRRLADRPVLVEWHRMRQELAGDSIGRAGLRDEYSKLRAEDPDNPDLMYLEARLLDAIPAKKSLFARAASGDSPSAHGLYAVAWDAWTRGDFVGALESLHSATKICPDKPIFFSFEKDLLAALGRYDELLAGQALDEAHLAADYPGVENRVIYLTAAGKGDEARALVDKYGKQIQEALGKDSGIAAKRDLLATLHAARGDLAEFGKYARASSSPGARFAGQLAAGNLKKAEAELGGGEVDTAIAFLFLYIAAEKETAERHLERAAAAFEGNSRMAHLSALLRGEADPEDVERFLDLPLRAHEFALASAAVMKKHPATAKTYEPILARFSYERRFLQVWLRQRFAIEEKAPRQAKARPKDDS